VGIGKIKSQDWFRFDERQPTNVDLTPRLLGQVHQDLVLRRIAVDLAHVERHRVQVGVDPSVIVRSVRRPVKLRYHAPLAT